MRCPGRQHTPKNIQRQVCFGKCQKPKPARSQRTTHTPVQRFARSTSTKQARCSAAWHLPATKAGHAKSGRTEAAGSRVQQPTSDEDELDAVLNTYKAGTKLELDCTNPRSILQLPEQTKEGFIDILTFVDTHIDITSGRHHTIGLAVSPIRVLSQNTCTRMEDAMPTAFGCGQGKAAAESYETSEGIAAAGHVDRPLIKLTLLHLPLLACWCTSNEGWHFLESGACSTCPFWTFRTILPRCSEATTAAEIIKGRSLTICPVFDSG